jgi:2',3'-cyclic-nucleotide 2'-phosphodiesterase
VRLLFCGDIVGRSGRKMLADLLPGLRERLRLDAVIVNAENAAGGFGLTPAIAREFYAAGADALTTGNHVWDQRELIGYIDGDPRLVRPLNMMPGTPGRGATLVRTPEGRRLAVIQVMGRLFMGSYDDPFRALDAELNRHGLGATVDGIVVDVHAEATSEKMALGHFADGRASAVIGTHTHVPTADAQILPGGTAYMTDVGMCGDYDSVIGMEKTVALGRFRSDLPGPRNTPALGEATLSALYIETAPRTGLAVKVAPLRIGGRLAPADIESER